MHRQQTASTVKDVASAAGVSTATVSRVVNDVGNVSEETKRKVLIAISQLEYTPNMFARELRRSNAGVPERRDRCGGVATRL